MSKNAFNMETLRTLDQKTIDEARQSALEILNNMGSKPEVKNRLIRDINAATSAKNICGIMWRTYLAGSGMRVTGSNWNNI